MRELSITERIERLEKMLGVDRQPPTPLHYPVIPWTPAAHCSRCGIKFEGAMGYNCQRADCPTMAFAQ